MEVFEMLPPVKVSALEEEGVFLGVHPQTLEIHIQFSEYLD